MRITFAIHTKHPPICLVSNCIAFKIDVNAFTHTVISVHCYKIACLILKILIRHM